MTSTATYDDMTEKSGTIVTNTASDESMAKNPVELGTVEELSTVTHAFDPAIAVLGQERIEYTEAEGRSVLRRIDRHILPMLMWVYCIQFADKTSLNYASLMGIRTDTHLVTASQQYSWVSSILYAGYILWE